MTRRQLLALPLAGTIQSALAADRTGFPGVAYRDYSRCLPDYLRSLAERAYQLRNRALEKLSTSEAIRDRQVWARETFWRLIGGMPARTSLNPHTMGSFQRPGYRVEKIVYESQPRFYISANLYVPTPDRGPFPGVLFQMGHSTDGKAADTYQRCCQGLARLGFMVLAFDPMGQGERTYYPDSTWHGTRLPSADDEHTLPGKQMLLLGGTSTRLQVWDAIRSLDLLASHPLADAKRLASTGQSGGGTLTMFLLAADDRLSAAVVCSGNTENFACAHFNPPGSTDDAEQNLLNSGPAGFDRWDLFYPFAPKPLLISVSDKDFFGTYSSEYISSGWEEYQKLKKVYETLGQPDRLAWADTPLPHGLSYDSRLQIYNWFRRHLQGESARITEEPPVAPEPDAILWASEAGSVVRMFHSETPFSLNKAQKVVVDRSEPRERLLAVEMPSPKARAAVLRRVPSREIGIEALEVPSVPGVWLPAWLFLPTGSDQSKPVILALDPAGRNVRWHEGELYHLLAQKGYPVCAADVRGIGDLAPEVGRGAAHYALPHHDEENYSWASLILGKPLLGQRVTDTLAIAAALRRHAPLSGRRVVLAAMRRMTIPALFAAALDPHIAELYLAGGLISYRSIIETEEYNHPFSNFVPTLLRHTDLPEIAASVAPRRICLAGVVDATGETLEEPAVRKLYGSLDNVVIRPKARWDLESLTGWETKR